MKQSTIKWGAPVFPCSHTAASLSLLLIENQTEARQNSDLLSRKKSIVTFMHEIRLSYWAEARPKHFCNLTAHYLACQGSWATTALARHYTVSIHPARRHASRSRAPNDTSTYRVSIKYFLQKLPHAQWNLHRRVRWGTGKNQRLIPFIRWQQECNIIFCTFVCWCRQKQENISSNSRFGREKLSTWL